MDALQVFFKIVLSFVFILFLSMTGVVYPGYALTIDRPAESSQFNRVSPTVNTGKNKRKHNKNLNKRIRKFSNRFIGDVTEDLFEDFIWGAGTYLFDQFDSDSILLSGYEKFQMEDCEGAIRDYTRALTINYNYANAYFLRSIAFYEVGKYQASVEDVNQALHINPYFAEAYLLRALLLTKSKSYQLAVKDCNQALLINPEYAQACVIRGDLYSIRTYATGTGRSLS